MPTLRGMGMMMRSPTRSHPVATLHRAALVDAPTPDALRVREDGHLMEDDDGRIASVGPWEDAPDGGYDRVREWPGMVLVPAFVDAHAHVPQHDIAGIGGADLLSWLEEIVFPAEAMWADPAVARRATRRFLREQREAGTVGGALFLTSHGEATRVAFGEMREAGFRGWAGKVLMDRGAPTDILDDSVETAIRDASRLARELDGPDVRFSVTPRFALSCSGRLLKESGALAGRMGLPVHTHVSESAGEIALVASRFPDAPHYTGVYEGSGLLGRDTILAHGVHLDAPEWGRIRSHGSCVAHCPLANTALHSGRFPIERVPEGARLALGSDVGAGPTPSLWRNMRHALDIHGSRGRAIGASRLLHLATVGGASAVGLSLGAFDMGQDAAFQVVDAPGFRGDAADTWLASVIRSIDSPRHVHVPEARPGTAT